MKNFNWSQFLGNCVIGVCILIAGVIISINLPGTTVVPSALDVTNTGTTAEYQEFLSQYEASAFLSIDSDELVNLINAGELDGIGTKIGESYVFSRTELEGWMNNKISGQ